MNLKQYEDLMLQIYSLKCNLSDFAQDITDIYEEGLKNCEHKNIIPTPPEGSCVDCGDIL